VVVVVAVVALVVVVIKIAFLILLLVSAADSYRDCDISGGVSSCGRMVVNNEVVILLVAKEAIVM
jgi:hypothetical protein